MTITISHTAAEGTIVTGDPRPHHGVLKDAGFRWSRNVGWYVPRSRDAAPQAWRIEAARKGLEAAGLTVEVEIDTDRRSVAEVEADRAARAADRAEALAGKADRKAAEAEATLDRAREMGSIIPLGQPILVGHHSERRDRNYRARIERTYDKGFEAHNEATEAARRAAAAEATQRQRESLGTTLRRIEKLEAEVRDIDRKLAGKPCPVSGRKRKPEAEAKTIRCPICGHDVDCAAGPAPVPVHYAWDSDRPPSGSWLDKLTARRAAAVEAIDYWRAHVDALAETGEKLWGPDDFAPGDRINNSGTVKRVNKKSLSVVFDSFAYAGFTNTVKYSEVKSLQKKGTDDGQ